METISSGYPDLTNFSVEFPLKSKLCLFCVNPITTTDLQVNLNDKSDDGDLNCERGQISQSTFLQAITLFCDYLKVDSRFSEVEQWALFGVDNFVSFLCCNECALIIQKLIKLHHLILETQASLKTELETLANQILLSSTTTTGEYCINACVQFRQEIINNYPSDKLFSDNETINEIANLPEHPPPPPKEATPITRRRSRPCPSPSNSTSYSGSRRPMPLSKKRTQTPAKPIITPESFVKLERLDLSRLSSFPDSQDQCQIHHAVELVVEDFNEGPPSPSISITDDPFTEDLNNSDPNSDVDYQPTPTKTRRRGKGLRKRGRPPKSKPVCNIKAVVENASDQDYIPPKESPEDNTDTIPYLLQKRRPGRPLKVGSRLYRARHNQEGPNHKPIYLLPPSPSSSPSSSSSPHSQHLMYFNVPFQKTSDFLLCLHPSCTFFTPLSPNSPSQQTAYSTIRFHIRHHHRFKSSPSPSQQLYFCHLCSTHLPTRLSYLHHRKSLHWTTPMPPVICQVCDLPLPSTSLLLKHLSSHKSPEELSILNLTTSTTPRRRGPAKVDPLKPLSHPCDQCSKSFKCFTELRIHKITHIPLEIRRQHQCHECGEKFTTGHSLQNHLNRVHLKTLSQDLNCKYCGRKFFTNERSKYEAHLRSHTGEKPFQCAECGKGFHQKWNLTMHERLHGDNTVTCEFCSEGFKTQKYLRRHQKKHHPEFVEKPNPKATLKYRQLEHTNNFIGPKLMFPCEPCQHVFKFKSILVSHLKRMHQMKHEKNEDFPNMWTFEDEGWVINELEDRPPPPGGWRGRVKKSKVKKEPVDNLDDELNE